MQCWSKDGGGGGGDTNDSGGGSYVVFNIRVINIKGTSVVF